MGSDSSIFAALLRPPKSVEDYQADNQARDANALSLLLKRQDLQEGQAKFADRERGLQEQNALRQLMGGPGFSLSNPDSQAALYRTAPVQAGPILKDFADTQGKFATTERTKAESLKTQGETLDNTIARHRAGLIDVNNEQDAAGWLQAQYNDPVLGPYMQQRGSLEDAVKRMATHTGGFEDWRRASAMGMAKNIELLRQQAAQYETGRHNLASEAGTRRGQDITARGQNMVDARARETNSMGKTPAGYRQTTDGNLQAIPGGPADLKLVGALNQDTQTLNASTSSMDRLATAANEVLNHPGLQGITGIRGALPNIPGSNASDAQALLNTLKSQVAFGVLQDMRNNSKTGGALGSVSDAEGKRLEANLAALEKAQSLEQFKSSLKKIVDYSQGAKDRLRDAYNLKHGNAPDRPTPQSQPNGRTELGGGFVLNH